jgi:thiol-disulfide isomerase/thioredoxin
MKFRLTLALLGLAGIAGGVMTALWLGASPAGPVDSRRPAFTLPDMAGQPRSIDEWDGKLLLVNFWATWCKPCREEIPLLVEFQDRYAGRGLQVLGLALDDPAPVRAYAAEMGINYPVLVDAMGVAKVQDAYGGNSLLPFSALVGRDGRILATHSGELKADDLRAWIEPRLDER